MLDGGVHFERQYQIATPFAHEGHDSTRAADIDRDRARYLMAKLFEEALISAIASEEEEYGSY